MVLKNSILCLSIVFGILICNLTICDAAATHKHTLNKERTEDGALHPKDHGSEHHHEFEHEVILGSVKDAEEFDNLSPEESKKRLAILVKKMDLNSDQFIDRHELKVWILRSFKMLAEEEAADRFEDIDEDNNEKVTWTEYLKDTYGMDSDEEDILDTENEDKLIADDKLMFNGSDLNQDGWLSSEEFVLFISPEEHPQMLPIILEQTLRDRDLNNDGRIDFQEFIGESGMDKDKEWIIVEKEKFDSEFDKDRDGVLNGNEILSWVVPSNK